MEYPAISTTLLDPMDRAAEILFGLIMALTFTCTIGIAGKGHAEIRQMLIGAIGCNLAWGLVDATMYLIGVLGRKNRNNMIFDLVQNSLETGKARQHISEALPPVVVSALGPEGLEHIRDKLSKVTDPRARVKLTVHDLKKAMALFFMIFISTFPVVVPFVFIRDTKLALRVSNLVAIVMMFLCGWSVAKYVGFSKWTMSIALIIIGIFLVGITIALGG